MIDRDPAEQPGEQDGFTLLELLMASVLGSFLIIAAFGMVLDSIRISEVLVSRVQLNAAARESFDMLLFGGRTGGNEVAGLLSHDTQPSPADTLSDIASGNYRLKLDDDDASFTATLSGQNVVPHDIACQAATNPIPACQGTETITMNGYLGGIPRFGPDSRRVNNRTSEIELTLATPYLLIREDATTRQSTEVFRTIFTLNQDLDLAP